MLSNLFNRSIFRGQGSYLTSQRLFDTSTKLRDQGNEEEALRSWRSALDQIYYHNAYKIPPNHKPKSETEKALQDSLRDMEMQCKERVDLLETLRKSRKEATESDGRSSQISTRRDGPPVIDKIDPCRARHSSVSSIGQNTIPAVSYPDLSRPPPPLPQRPAILQQKGSDSLAERSYSSPQISTSGSTLPYPPPTISGASIKSSREHSPEKKSRMLTTLRAGKDGKRPSKSPRATSGFRSGPPPASSKAAGLAWDSIRASGQKLGQTLSAQNSSSTTLNSPHPDNFGGNAAFLSEPTVAVVGQDFVSGRISPARPANTSNPLAAQDQQRPRSYHAGDPRSSRQTPNETSDSHAHPKDDLISLEPSIPPTHDRLAKDSGTTQIKTKSPVRQKPPADYLSYRNEYPAPAPISKAAQASAVRPVVSNERSKTSTLSVRQRSPQRKSQTSVPSGVARRPVANISSPRSTRHSTSDSGRAGSSESADENTSSSREEDPKQRQDFRKTQDRSTSPDPFSKRNSSDALGAQLVWEQRIKHIKKHLPKGVDENAANQIFNEIVVQGDEVHWDDVAGLDVAKKALKEAVVYPFLRPDLFMGLREPARGMLLFGPPGTGKTMLARAVATESRSTFFAISASSLTSKWLGESEKLVRALFALARALAPSIIFVDEIDSLLSSRGGSSEHESTRRIKTEFLIQWSDLQRAAAGKQQTDKEKQEGDASRVLVLAATNMPWAIDEAARRRFVRRQYIPLPEAEVRATQLRTLLGHQKHNLNKQDIQVLVELTDGTFTAIFRLAATDNRAQASPALISRRWRRMQPWVLYEV